MINVSKKKQVFDYLIIKTSLSCFKPLKNVDDLFRPRGHVNVFIQSNVFLGNRLNPCIIKKKNHTSMFLEVGSRLMSLYGRCVFGYELLFHWAFKEAPTLIQYRFNWAEITSWHEVTELGCFVYLLYTQPM